MALRDIFKKKKIKKTTVPSPHLPAKRAAEVKPKEKPREVIYKTEPHKVREKKIGEAWKILKTPHITEKATDLVGKNQYAFKIWPGANKVEIKKAIEDLYGVDVMSVKIINIPRKGRRLGRISGWRTGYKKAIIKIKEGQKIEVLPR